MNIWFSDAEKLWIDKQRILKNIEQSFFHKLRSMIHEVGQRFQNMGWRVNVSEECLQVYRPHWQTDWQGIHYEAFLNADCLLQGRLDTGLHVEINAPHHGEVANNLYCYLRPHESQLLKKYGRLSSGFRILPCSSHSTEDQIIHVLEGTIDLTELTSDRMYDALERLTQTESFVEEALFRANGTKLWRTAFLSGDPPLRLERGGTRDTGGQTFREGKGRLDSPCLHIDGTREGNYKLKDRKQPDNYDPTNKGSVNIMELVRGRECELRNGDRLYLSCVVKTELGGRLWFDGQGHPICALFDVPGPPNWIALDVQGQAEWQHVTIPLAPVCTHEDYDFAQQGARVFLISQTQDPNFVFSSIEIGRRSKGDD